MSAERFRNAQAPPCAAFGKRWRRSTNCGKGRAGRHRRAQLCRNRWTENKNCDMSLLERVRSLVGPLQARMLTAVTRARGRARQSCGAARMIGRIRTEPMGRLAIAAVLIASAITVSNPAQAQGQTKAGPAVVSKSISVSNKQRPRQTSQSRSKGENLLTNFLKGMGWS